MGIIYIVTHAIMGACIVVVIASAIRSIVAEPKLKLNAGSYQVRKFVRNRKNSIQESTAPSASEQWVSYFDKPIIKSSKKRKPLLQDLHSTS